MHYIAPGGAHPPQQLQKYVVPSNLNRNTRKHKEVDWFLHLREQSFADGTKLGGVSESPAAHVAIQWDLNGTEIFTGRNLMKFNEKEMSCPAPGEE